MRPIPASQAFADKFQKEYNYKPDHNGLKGYSGDVHRQGRHREDRQVRSQGLRQTRCTASSLSAKDYPGILMDVSFDKNGDLDRESFMTKVVNGKQEVIAVLPAASAK